MKTFLVAAVVVSSLVAGCTSSTDDPVEALRDDLALAGAPVLYLNLTVGNETYRFTSGNASAGSGSATATATASATGNATKSGSASNSTTGNGTSAKGNSTGNATKAKASGPGGDAPLNVSVTLGAKGLPTDKVVSWTLDFGDGKAAAAAKSNATGNSTGNATGSASASGSASGTSSASGAANGTASGKATGAETGAKLPVTLNHTYAQAGNHTIVFKLDIANATVATLKQPIEVLGGNASGNLTAIAPGTPLGLAVFDEEGTLTAGLQVPFVTGCGNGQGGDDDLEWIVPATGPDNVTAALVGHFLVVLDSSGPVSQDQDVYLLDAEGNEVGAGATGAADETIDIEGPFPAGTYTINVQGCVSVNTSYTVHAEATLVAA